jgi:hypothetical protein
VPSKVRRDAARQLGAPVRLRGKAKTAEGRAPFRRIEIVSENESIATVDEGEVDVTLTEGGSVTVEAPGEGLVLVRSPKPSVERGAWSELRERPEAQGFKRNIVAPFAYVELRVTTTLDGEPVEVYGTVFEYTFADDAATFREGASRRPSRMLAQKIAFGEPAEDLMRAMTMAIADEKREHPAESREPKNRKDQVDDSTRPRLWAEGVPLGGLLAAFAFCMIEARLAASAIDAWRYQVFALEWAALAISFRPGPTVPRFRSRGELVGKRSGWWFAARCLLAIFPTATIAWSWADEPLSVGVATATAVVFVLGWSLEEFLWNGREHAVVRRLALAKPIDPFKQPGRGGTCLGRVVDSNLVKVGGRRAAMGVVTHYSKGHGDDPDTVEGTEFSGGRAFRIRVEEGEIEVDPEECLWATTVHRRPENPHSDYDAWEWVPFNARVVVFGQYAPLSHAHGGPASRLLSMGTQPAILFATSAEGDPLRRATQIVRHRRVTLFGLAAVAGAIAALAILAPP